MKKITLIFFLISFHFAVNAQSKSEKEVAQAVETLRLALLSGDRMALKNITSADLTYVHSGGKAEDQAAFVEALASGKSDFLTIELTKQNIKVTGKTAVVRHLLSAQTNDNGKSGDVHLIVMLIFQKQHGQWKLLARQAAKQPAS